jgi:hypothetical protein
MNTLKNFVTAVILIGAGFVAATPIFASNSIVAVLPEIGSLTAQVGEWIAGELQSYFTKALNMPRMPPPGRSSSVAIIEGDRMIVEAKRLPPQSEPFRGLSGPRKKQASL